MTQARCLLVVCILAAATIHECGAERPSPTVAESSGAERHSKSNAIEVGKSSLVHLKDETTQQWPKKASFKKATSGEPWPVGSTVKVMVEEPGRVRSYNKDTKKYSVKVNPATWLPKDYPEKDLTLVEKYKWKLGEGNLDYSSLDRFADEKNDELKEMADNLEVGKTHQAVENAIDKHNKYVKKLWQRQDHAMSLGKAMDGFRAAANQEDLQVGAKFSDIIKVGKVNADLLKRMGPQFKGYMDARLEEIGAKHQAQDEALLATATEKSKMRAHAQEEATDNSELFNKIKEAVPEEVKTFHNVAQHKEKWGDGEEEEEE